MTANFFLGLYQNNTFKVVYALYQLLVPITAPLVLYSIHWYISYGAHFQYRTLMNKLLSHFCLLNLLGYFTSRFMHCLIFFTGPLSMSYCSFSLFCGRFFFMSAMGELVVQQIIKFFYIFQWKYLAGMNDDFAAIYLTLFNILFYMVFSFITYFFWLFIC